MAIQGDQRAQRAHQHRAQALDHQRRIERLGRQPLRAGKGQQLSDQVGRALRCLAPFAGQTLHPRGIAAAPGD